jgi:hypothetical protein
VLALVTGTLLVRRRAARVATGAASAAPAAAATVAPAAIAPLAIAPARAASAPTATGGSEADAEAQAQAPERPHAQAAIPGRGRDPVGVVPTPAERAAQRRGNRLARPAAVAASGLVPLVVRRLLRKRGRSGRRRR